MSSFYMFYDVPWNNAAVSCGVIKVRCCEWSSKQQNADLFWDFHNTGINKDNRKEFLETSEMYKMFDELVEISKPFLRHYGILDPMQDFYMMYDKHWGGAAIVCGVLVVRFDEANPKQMEFFHKFAAMGINKRKVRQIPTTPEAYELFDELIEASKLIGRKHGMVAETA